MVSLGFSNFSNLKEHKKTHTADKVFTCDECGKSFNMQRKLVKHRARHTGERPHSCSACGECLSSASPRAAWPSRCGRCRSPGPPPGGCAGVSARPSLYSQVRWRQCCFCTTSCGLPLPGLLTLAPVCMCQTFTEGLQGRCPEQS